MRSDVCFYERTINAGYTYQHTVASYNYRWRCPTHKTVRGLIYLQSEVSQKTKAGFGPPSLVAERGRREMTFPPPPPPCDLRDQRKLGVAHESKETKIYCAKRRRRNKVQSLREKAWNGPVNGGVVSSRCSVIDAAVVGRQWTSSARWTAHVNVIIRPSINARPLSRTRRICGPIFRTNSPLLAPVCDFLQLGDELLCRCVFLIIFKHGSSKDNKYNWNINKYTGNTFLQIQTIKS